MTHLMRTGFCGTKEALAVQKRHCYTKKRFYEAFPHREAVGHHTEKRGKS